MYLCRVTATLIWRENRDKLCGVPGATVEPTVEIAAFVAAARHRLRARQLWWALGRGGASAVGGLIALLGGAALAPGAGWRPFALLATGVGLGVGAVVGARGLARWRRADSVARLVGELKPNVGDDLWSAIELERELPHLEADQLLSPTLVRAQRQRAAELVRTVDVARMLPVQRLAQVWPLVVALGLLLLMTRAWPTGVARGWLMLTSAEPPATTSNEPIVGDVELTLIYPAYTGLPPRVIPGSTGHVLALPGTRVTVAARALVTVERDAALALEVEGKPARELPVEVRDGHLSVSFDVQARGSWRFVLGVGAHRVREPEAHGIDLEPDRPPRVDLYAPADPLEVAGPRRIELAWSVDDDYGLGAIELVWKSGDGPEQRRAVATPPPGSRAQSGKLEWDLAELDLKPGARVSYHLEARDNDDQPRPNVGRSRTLTLVMFSPREKSERALADENALLDELVQLLGDRLELKRDASDEALVESYTRIHSRADALLLALARAEQSAAELPKNKAASARDGKTILGEMHARQGKLVHDEELTLADLREKRRKSAQHGGAARPLDKGNAVHIAELERDAILLDDLLGKQRLEELLAVADEMAQTRDRLKQLMSEYKKTRSDAVKKEIERELKQLERKMAELAEKARQLSAELPDQFLNAEAMGNNDLQKRMDELRQMLARGDVDKAMAELEKMSQSLDKMMQSMEQDLRGYRSQRFGPEEKALGEIENKISDLAEEQRRVKDETDSVRQRARAEVQRQMKDKADALTRRTRDKVAKLKKQLDSLDPQAVSPYDQEELQRIRTRVGDTDRALGEGDLDEARAMARQAHEGLRNMAMDLRDEEQRGWAHAPPRLKKTREQVGDDEMLAREVVDELDKAMPRPSSLMSGDDQKKLAELAKRQDQLRKRAQELGKELGKPKLGPDGKPMAMPIPREIQPGLRDAGQHMERAAGQLRGQAAREAVGEESQALDKLSQMKEQMQRERRPRDTSGDARMDKEPVRIPGADEFRAPKEFRQDLLDAMKRGAPSEYKEQLKRYYEELAK
jgi:hypothetical protein